MAEQFLNGAQVIAVLQQPCGEAVAKGMRSDMFVDADLAACGSDGLAHSRCMQMMPAQHAGHRICRDMRRRKKKLPAGFIGGLRILSRQRCRHVDLAITQ